MFDRDVDTQKLRLLDRQVLVFLDWEVDEDGNNSIKLTKDCRVNMIYEVIWEYDFWSILSAQCFFSIFS